MQFWCHLFVLMIPQCDCLLFRILPAGLAWGTLSLVSPAGGLKGFNETIQYREVVVMPSMTKPLEGDAMLVAECRLPPQ